MKNQNPTSLAKEFIIKLLKPRYFIPIGSSLAIFALTLFAVKFLGDSQKTTVPQDSQAAEETVTGDYYIPTDAEVATQLQLFNQILARLPISTSLYSLKFDYYTDTLQATLYPPCETSKLSFLNWLKAQGYGNLPKSYFSYLLSSTSITPTPTLRPTPTPIPTAYSGLGATFSTTKATFNFTYTGPATTHRINLSTSPTLATDVYLTFASGTTSPISITNPTKWDKYTCGRTLYWQVVNSSGIKSPIKATTVASCTTLTPTPTIKYIKIVPTIPKGIYPTPGSSAY